jgi:hypothetical protein
MLGTPKALAADRQGEGVCLRKLAAATEWSGKDPAEKKKEPWLTREK